MEKMAGRIQQTQVSEIWSPADRRGGDAIHSDRDEQQTSRQVQAAGTAPVGGTSRSKGKFKTSSPTLRLHTPPSSLLGG